MKKTLPQAPGIYLFKDKNQLVIYIGKAKSLKNRVQSYFRKTTDWKIQSLIDEYADIDYILTQNETEALLLEAQLIRDHQPKYNVLLKNGQPYVYILFTKDELSEIKLVRNKKEKGTFFGPFLHKMQAHGVYRFLVETFKLKVCNKKIENGCLEFHLNLCAGNCKSNFDPADYLFRLDLAQQALRKNHKKFLKNLNVKIAEHTQSLHFEKAKHLHEYRENFQTIFTTLHTRFTESKFKNDIFVATTPRYSAHVDTNTIAQQLQNFLGTAKPIVTLDCFDISHFQSSYLVGSCIRFTNGLPDKNNFRRFKIKSLDKQNDYAALQEIVARRYKNYDELPDAVLIDGGKGQLNAVKPLLADKTYLMSLAKKEELLFCPNFPEGIPLNIKTDVGKLLIALRDYAHYFAISYHKKRRHTALKEEHDNRKLYYRKSGLTQ